MATAKKTKKRGALGSNLGAFTGARRDPGAEKPLVPKGRDVPTTVEAWDRQPPLDQHPVAVYLGRLGQGSRRSMKQSVELIAATLTGGKSSAFHLDWAGVRYQHTTRLRTMLQDGEALAWIPQRPTKNGNGTSESPRDVREANGRTEWLLQRRLAPGAINRILAALRGVLRETWRLGLMTAEEFHRAVDIKQVKATTLQRGRLVPEGEQRALFRSCKEDDRRHDCAMRDRAILALMFGCGLRRSEFVALNLEDYNADNETLTIREGKGRKTRIAHVKNGARDALEDWIEIRGDEPGPLFWRFNMQGRMQPGKRLSDQAIYWLVNHRAERAGIKDQLTPHDGRRTYISTMLDNTGDLSLVGALVGHSRTDTTRGYDMRGERERAKAAGTIFVPVDG